MPFFDLDAAIADYVTPKYSRAFGPLVTGTQIEVGRLRFETGQGSVEHAHPQEQIVVVLRGRLRVRIAGETQDLGPGQGFLVPPNVPHDATALEPTEVLSCKALVAGQGHRI